MKLARLIMATPIGWLVRFFANVPKPPSRDGNLHDEGDPA